MKIDTQKPFLPIYSVKGSGYDLGFQIGQLAKHHIQKTLIPENKWFMERKNLDDSDPTFLNSTLALTKKYLPKYVEEMKGLADGAEVPFRDIWVINSADRETYDLETCSDIIIKSSNGIIHGHNEDFNNKNSDFSYFLHIISENGTEIFSHTYPGALSGTSFAVNSHGLSITQNTLPNPNQNMGISRKVIDRWLLEAESIDDAINRINITPRSGVFSYNICSLMEHRAINVETTEFESFLTEIYKNYFHTNHYLHPSNRHIPIHPTSTTKTRFSRLEELVPLANATLEDVLVVLSDPKIFCTEREIYPGWFRKSFSTVIYEFSTNRLKTVIFPYNRDPETVIRVDISAHTGIATAPVQLNPIED
ncbi:MAG: hypothetical protein JW776_11810 [Candidatus Lokiarchaeota archaeon]|nr:hypothetical protein [Candidatus Lokiarchaeota archaeon]